MSFFKKVNLPPSYQIILKILFPKGRFQVLDLGCGSGIAGELFNSAHIHEFIGVDIFKPYLKKCRVSGYYKEVYKADITKVKLDWKSYDVILLLQVLEHLKKVEAVKLIQKAVKAARKAVIISLPNGVSFQKEYDENDFHTHKSTWGTSDLQRLGFKVYGQSFRPIFGKMSYGCGIEANWWQKIAVTLSIIISPIIFLIPNLGAQLIAVKYIND